MSRPETAEAALRSTRRMRRLVGDLLLLARADARRVQPHRPTDLAAVLVDAASELGPMAERHELSIDAAAGRGRRCGRRPAPSGAQPARERRASHAAWDADQRRPPRVEDGEAVLTVEDAGSGHPARSRGPRIRALRARGTRRGPGLGPGSGHRARGHSLARRPRPDEAGAGGTGTRFEIRIPSSGAVPEAAPAAGDQTSTTTGRTIGRRRNRS